MTDGNLLIHDGLYENRYMQSRHPGSPISDPQTSQIHTIEAFHFEASSRDHGANTGFGIYMLCISCGYAVLCCLVLLWPFLAVCCCMSMQHQIIQLTWQKNIVCIYQYPSTKHER